MNLQISKINTKKNLLAFSGGVDSSALFFLLLKNNIPFDIAIVNYNIREQSKKEILYAKQLGEKYKKEVFIKDITEEISSNFEKKARDLRYAFFDEIIEQNSYESLITAHQLNDKLEWFLMQFSKGAGLVELLSFEEFSIRKSYQIIKPMLNISRDEILNFLEENKIKYFIDESNIDTKYKRNYFRKNYSNKFLDEYKDGVKKSFEYLKKDKDSLYKEELVFQKKELEIFKSSKDFNIDIRTIDKSLKRRGILLSKASKDEILKQKECVISHEISIAINEDFIYICPYIKEIMPKKFKEKCRIKHIPKNTRAYIFKENLLEDLVI
ncbi:tRNA lysidine(34) synthetase TilS [Arcobacter arenosus]|uniref:tRNA lysidine(34) synthetase TilS n=1 Tax=Arcobacter arenosus TaxID=2576037 RepID=UPI003BADB7CB